MMVKIKCTECGTESSFLLTESSYEGPYQYWKCRELFTFKVENSELENCEPLNQEEFDRQQEIEALKAKLKQC